MVKCRKAILIVLGISMLCSLCAGCSKTNKATDTDVEIPYVDFPSSSLNGASGSGSIDPDEGWERIGQSQITVYDEDGNSMIYDMVIDSRDAGDTPPVEDSTRMSRVLDAGEPVGQESADWAENYAMWIASRVFVGVTNRDAAELAACGVENYSLESMDAMYEALKPVCTESTEMVFLSTQLIGTDTVLVNAIAPNFTTSLVVEMDASGLWKIPYVSGMLEAEGVEEVPEVEDIEDTDQESAGSSEGE